MEVTTTKTRTYEDYAALPEGAPYQLIDGELIMSPAPSSFHQSILANLLVELSIFVRERKLGKVLCSPLDVYFSNYETYQPDIVFIANDRVNIIAEQKIEGAPDLIMEILSPSTGYFDLTHKKDVYAESGVKEYWIVDPLEMWIEVHENVAGDYRLIQKTRAKGMVASKLLEGFGVDLEQVFAK